MVFIAAINNCRGFSRESRNFLGGWTYFLRSLFYLLFLPLCVFVPKRLAGLLEVAAFSRYPLFMVSRFLVLKDPIFFGLSVFGRRGFFEEHCILSFAVSRLLEVP